VGVGVGVLPTHLQETCVDTTLDERRVLHRTAKELDVSGQAHHLTDTSHKARGLDAQGLGPHQGHSYAATRVVGDG
jgi:hypothetical protein